MHCSPIQCCLMNFVIAMFDVMVNSRTFKDLCNEILGLSSTCPLFKYFQGLEFRREKNSSTFKDFQGCVGTLCKFIRLIDRVQVSSLNVG